MNEDSRETGQINYEAFAGVHGWTIAGRAMARWDQLAEAEQDAWRAAAHEVMQKGWVTAQHDRTARRAARGRHA